MARRALAVSLCHAACPLTQRDNEKTAGLIWPMRWQLASVRAGLSSLTTTMSCYDLCPPKTSVAVPQPIAESCNELCARQCPDSSAFIQPPPVVVTFPGPILSSFPQQAVVGSSGAPAFGGSLGLGGLYGAGATQGSGGLCTFGRPYAAPACSPCVLPRYTKKLWDTCGPC
ncbi:feather keratin 3-like isoform 1-T1 [Alca torda]